MDEAGIKKNEAIEYGWAKKGERLQDLRNGSKAKSVNIIASLSEKKIVAPFIFEGNCNSEIFRMYLYDVLKPYLRKNNVLILDNASFHKHSVVMKFSEEVGCKVLFLPPYSPDFNDIECHWHSVKTKLRKIMRDNFEISPSEALCRIFACPKAEF